MRVNKATINLIKEFEGYRPEAYLDPVGVCTIGYGTTAMAGVGIVPVIGMAITHEEAEWYLEQAVDKFAGMIWPLFVVEPNENEFGAFVSLAYNIGPTAFRKSSAIRHFNNNDKERAAKSILLWNKAGGKVLSGLVRRREAEKQLFLTDVPEAAELPPAIVKKEIALNAALVGGMLASLALFWEQFKSLFEGWLI